MHTFLSRTVLQLRWFLVLSAALLALGALAGYLAIGSLPETTAALRRELLSFFSIAEGWSRGELFLFVFLNNSIKALLMMYLGLAFGIAPASFLIINGLALQVIAARGAEALGTLVVLAALIPHGVIEVVAVVLGAAVGLRLGLNLFRRLRGQENRLMGSLGDAWRIYWRIVLPMLVIAAAIEIWITPEVVALAAS